MTAEAMKSQDRKWPEEGVSRVPAWIYSDEGLFEREMEKFYAGNTWNFVGLEADREVGQMAFVV